MDIAIITGASRGIGRATAIKLSKNYGIVVNYNHNKDEAMKVVATIENNGGEAIMVQGNVGNYEDAKKIAKEAANFGKIKVLINNAGIYSVKPLNRTLPSEWEQIFQVNVFGMFNMIHAVLEHMDWGTIINIASIIGLHPISNAAPYCASKAAVIALTKSLAQELAPKIRVTCVAPGPTDTDMLRKVHGYMPADPPERVAEVIENVLREGKRGDCTMV